MGEYTIRGGDKGRERLAILTNTLAQQTRNLLADSKLRKDFNCLDLGCGSGAVSLELLKYLDTSGSVLGIDIDPSNVRYAQSNADKLNLANISFEHGDIYSLSHEQQFDLVYSRFLLSHLNNPEMALSNIYKALSPNGMLIIEDTDFSGHFSYPRNEYFDQYVLWYQKLLKTRSANANIGPELMGLLEKAGFRDISFEIKQPAHIDSQGKLMAEITLEAVSVPLLAQKICTKSELERTLKELKDFRKRSGTILSMPRIFQYRARK
jgi:ubiquinone/menaquinone biosynthesis C-methylase UbiE